MPFYTGAILIRIQTRRLQADVFELDMGEEGIGQLEKIEIGFASDQSDPEALEDESWFLSTVDVQHLGTGSRQVFLYENWISADGMPRVEMSPWRDGDLNVYKVPVLACLR